MFLKYRCVSCHSADSEARAPVLEDLFGRPVVIERRPRGQGRRGLHPRIDSLSQHKIVAGYENIMPTFKGQVSEEEIFELIAFIQSLKPGKTPESGGELSAARDHASHQYQGF